MSPRPNVPSRPHSVPDRRSFRMAVFFIAVHYLCVLAMFTCAVILALHPHPILMSGPLVAAVVATASSWLVAFFFRRSARCPQCRGTPLHDSGSAVHVKATRLRPLGHAASAAWMLLFTGRFRCKDCATPFDLHKPTAQERVRKTGALSPEATPEADRPKRGRGGVARFRRRRSRG